MNKEDRKDLVERLRTTPTERTWDGVGRPYDYPKHLPIEAADEIERLRAGIKRLSDEEEKLAETTDGEEFSLVSIAAQLASAEAEIARLRRELEGARKALEQIADYTRRCDHDLGFDREMGPLGCSLGDRCVCMPIHMTARSALADKEGR